MLIRERTEKIEEENLSPYAALAKDSKGRTKFEEQCPIRTVYQQDRDRIIHCKAFRRLKQKTQVFLSPQSDHYRTRLTHTLEVSQIARTISRALMLNEDLTEAISLGHDLGHTPFGHAGENVLNKLIPGGFRHFEQSVRVVEKLEKNGNGLNLTDEVKDGILCHTRGTPAKTLEGRIVKIADRIAYINHDIDDAVRAKVLNINDIPEKSKKLLGNSRSERINTLVTSLIENSFDNKLKMADDVQEAFDILHKFMFDYVYLNPYARVEEKKIPDLIEGIYRYFYNNPNKMSDEAIIIAKEEGIQRAVCDYIAGMTDKFAIQVFSDVYIPKAWGI